MANIITKEKNMMRMVRTIIQVLALVCLLIALLNPLFTFGAIIVGFALILISMFIGWYYKNK